MKRIFLGITYILLAVITFVYLLIPCLDGVKAGNGNTSVLVSTADTGLPVIGLIFVFPTFVFTVIALCNDKAMFAFLRDVFGLFTGLFVIASTTIMVVRDYNAITSIFVPVIIGLCSIIITSLSAYGVITAISQEKLQVKEQESEE